MTLIEKGTAEVHFTSRRSKGLHPVQQVDETAEAEFPMAEKAAGSKATNFTADFLLEHSSAGGMYISCRDWHLPGRHTKTRGAQSPLVLKQ
jgi:hypothetical protein